MAGEPTPFGGDRPELDALPRARAGASAVELDDGTAIYDDVGHAFVLLNTSAAAVWRRCDGNATVGQIVEGLAREHDVGDAEIREDVWLTLGKLASLDLVADARDDT